jgi:tryptophan synthase alpha subunit
LDAIKNIEKFAGTKIQVAVGYVIRTPSHMRLMSSAGAGADAIIMGSAVTQNVTCLLTREKCFRNHNVL